MNQKSSLNKIKDAKFLRVCTTVLAEMQRLKIPGVAMGIFNKGREFTAGFGVTSIENPLPVTPDTLFQTGSISKTFTGTIIMSLVEAGKIDLDAPVRKYLPELKLADKDVAERVTIRHLLTHSSGMASGIYTDDPIENLMSRKVKGAFQSRMTLAQVVAHHHF